MRRFVPLCLAATLYSLAPSQAEAQAGASPPGPRNPGTRAPALAPLPPPLEQDDKMLEQVAPPANVVSTWDDALSALKLRSTDLRIAFDEIERGNGQWREALAASLPNLTAGGSVTGNLLRNQQTICVTASSCTTVTIPDAVSYGGNVNLVQPVLALRAWHATKTADLARQVAELSAEDLKRVLTIALANSIVSVVTSERISEINRIGLRAALDRLSLARRRVALGAGNALDTVRAEQDVAVVRSSVVTGDESVRRARETLGLALGRAEPWGVPPDINLNGLEASARASCSEARSLDERADIAAAEQQALVARRNIDDVWLQFWPTVDLVSTFSIANTPLANGLHEAWTISGVLSVPLFDGGARYGALRDARAVADQAAQRLEAARRNAVVQIEQARRGVDVADQSRLVAEQARDLARETERLSRFAFQAGTGTSLDLIESGRRLREAETQLALQEYGLVQARIAALLALSRCRW